MRNKKIALIDPVGIKAGMDSYDMDLMTALFDQGSEVFLYSNFKWDEYPANSFPYFSEKIGHKFSEVLLRPLKYLKVLRHARNRKCTSVLIHVFHFNKMDEWLLKKIKAQGFQAVVIVHDVISFVRPTEISALNRICENLADVLIVHTSTVQEELASYIRLDAVDKIKVIPHGHSISLTHSGISRAEARKELMMEEDKIIALFFGMIKPNKGLDILLKAWGKVESNMNLIIAGRLREPTFKFYQEIIDADLKHRKPRLILRQVSNQERDLLFKAADFIVLPYRRIYQSGVLLMAMSYGLPVIASGIKGFTEIITHKNNGILFAPEDSEELALAINELSSNSDLRKTLSENALKIIEEQNNWSKIAADFINIIS